MCSAFTPSLVFAGLCRESRRDLHTGRRVSPFLIDLTISIYCLRCTTIEWVWQVSQLPISHLFRGPTSHLPPILRAHLPLPTNITSNLLYIFEANLPTPTNFRTDLPRLATPLTILYFRNTKMGRPLEQNCGRRNEAGWEDLE